MKILLILLMTSLFAGELEVDGNLTVTEGVTATSFVGDGSGLTNLTSFGDMKPSRIYKYERLENISFNFNVPQDKIWLITAIGDNDVQVEINGMIIYLSHPYSGPNYIIGFAGDSFSSCSCNDVPFLVSIYEYSISGSGSDQGMDYVEP